MQLGRLLKETVKEARKILEVKLGKILEGTPESISKFPLSSKCILSFFQVAFEGF